jgi:methylmalonyl-CoA/ethylmalonyl-CoA epimerase
MSVRLVDIDHVGIAVASLDEAVEHYRKTLGADPHHSETIEEQGVREVLFRAGTSFIQLLEPLGPDTPVGKFIERKGPGLHHIGYRVSSVEQTLSHLKSEGVRLIDEVPRIGSMGNTIAFVHPKGFDGVLVELVEQRDIQIDL